MADKTPKVRKPQPEDAMTLPFDEDALYEEQDQEAPIELAVGAFKYDGRGMTAEQFTEHVRTYNFGTIPPDFIVLHNTAVPTTVYTSPDFPSGWIWDSREAGLSEAQIKQKRKKLLDRIRDDYANRLGWDAGPHLFIDNKYIWLFTPMHDYGTHAKWGNKFERTGKIHYSIGIEVVGYYAKKQWPPEVRRLVRHAVTTIRDRLGTFELKYMYPNGGPGIIGTGDNQQPAHREKQTWGGISSHRDYNKPECPGGAITEDFYMKVLRGQL